MELINGYHNNYRMTKKQKELLKRMIRSVGYLPMERVYYIDKKINGIVFKLYTYRKSDVEKYIRSKMRAFLFGYLK